MSDVDITLSYPWQGHEVGERVSVEPALAKRLVRAGVGVYATKKDAAAAGEPAPDPPAAKRTRR